MKVLFYGNVLEYTRKEKSYNAGGCPDIRELINELGRYYGGSLSDFLLGEETCLFLVNGKGIILTGGLITKLRSDDKIEVLPFTEAG
jgi:molybdopterin converting factor small subunit